MKSPAIKMWFQFVAASIVIGAVLCLVAGTIDYWQAWAYLVANAVSGIPLILLFLKDPILLENRTKAGPTKEKRPIQKIIVALAAIPGVASFILPALDHRFGWSNAPWWVCIAGDLLILVGMWMVYRVFKANSYGSATVEVVEDQKVISTGPYGIVRNPMYASAVVYLVGLSLALGSYWGLIASVLTVLGLVWRLFDEEKIPYSKSSWLHGIPCQGALAFDTRDLLTVGAWVPGLRKSEPV